MTFETRPIDGVNLAELVLGIGATHFVSGKFVPKLASLTLVEVSLHEHTVGDEGLGLALFVVVQIKVLLTEDTMLFITASIQPTFAVGSLEETNESVWA